ncbi:MAG: hypothetical protein ACXWGX_17245, partial [Usitatibacter sp.]
GRAAARPPLAHFVVLSMLLHAFFILLFGAPSGGSREGRAMWGSLDVTLAEPSFAPGPSLRLDRGIAAERPAVAATKKPRAVRESTPKPPRPVAAPPAPTPLELSTTKEIIPPITSDARPAAPPPPPEPRVEPLPVQPLFAPIPRPDRSVTPEVKTEIVPTVPTPPAEVPVPPAPAPLPPAPAPLERVMAPRVEVPPAEAAAMPAPLVQPLPPTPVESSITPPVERTPMEMPVLPVPPIERTAAPRIEPSTSARENAVPVEQRIAPPPPAIERAEARPPERELPAKAESAPRAPAVAPSLREADVFGAPREAPPAASDAGKELHIDLDAARRRAREMAREGTGNRAALPFPMPPVPERKSKMETAIENARKPDCRTAYQSLGLLAVVPLVANEFGEGTCRW